MPLSDVLGSQEAADPTAGVPQAQTAAIAKRLLGEDGFNRFGDVVGARPSTWRDTLRDFTIGMTKGADAVEVLKMRQRENFQEAVYREQRAAIAKAKVDQDNVKSVLDTIVTVSKLPPGHRTGILKSQLQALGIEPDPSALKMFTDSDLIANMPIDSLFEAAQRGDGTIDMSKLAAVFGNGKAAADFYVNMIRAQKDREQTQKIALDMLRSRVSTAKTIEDNQRAAEKHAVDLETKRVGLKTKKIELRNLRAGTGGLGKKAGSGSSDILGQLKSAGVLDGLDGAPGTTPGGNTFKVLP
jgi:hypothetical protein